MCLKHPAAVRPSPSSVLNTNQTKPNQLFVVMVTRCSRLWFWFWWLVWFTAQVDKPQHLWVWVSYMFSMAVCMRVSTHLEEVSRTVMFLCVGFLFTVFWIVAGAVLCTLDHSSCSFHLGNWNSSGLGMFSESWPKYEIFKTINSLCHRWCCPIWPVGLCMCSNNVWCIAHLLSQYVYFCSGTMLWR